MNKTLAVLDRILHAAHIPHRFWWRLCDAYDLSLGVPDTPENFPRRHGFYRLSHIATSSGRPDPTRTRCSHCNARMSEWHTTPCALARRPVA